MGRSTPQLEFKWPAWFRALRPPVPQKTKPVRDDGGLTAWCAEAAADLSLPELARKVRVSWNPRMQTTAGRAWWPDRSIELNPQLRRRRYIEPHGPDWQAACADLGIAGEQPFHTLPFKRRRMKRNHAYICPNCFTTIHRVKPIQRSVACYDCCRKHNHGTYHDRFRLIKTSPADGEASTS